MTRAVRLLLFAVPTDGYADITIAELAPDVVACTGIGTVYHP